MWQRGPSLGFRRNVVRLRIPLSTLVVLVTSLALAGPAAAINSYNAQPSDRAEVGTLIVQFWDDDLGGWQVDWECSGSMVDSDTFLTAAHCVTDWGSKPPRFFVSLDSDVEPALAPLRAEGGLADSQAAQAVAALTSTAGLDGVHMVEGTESHPVAYPGPESDPMDIAVVDVPAAALSQRWSFTPAQLPSADELSQIGSKALAQDTWTTVGYGEQEKTLGPDQGFPGGGVRMEAPQGFTTLNKAWVRLDMHDEHGYGGACYGDSGGPNFVNLGGQDVLAAITITGDVPCYATNVDYRTDTASARSFLAAHVSLP
jgi:hypothetical protein